MKNQCEECGNVPSFFSSLSQFTDGRFLCKECFGRFTIQDEEAREQRGEQNREAAKSIIVTTTPGVDGFRISSYLGIESVEYVIGVGFTEELLSDLDRLAGERLTDYENKLKAAKRQALEALKLRAAELGANAVVGVDFDYVVFRGPRLGVIVNGTLVQLEPLIPESQF